MNLFPLVILNGAVLAGTPPAELVLGHVLVPAALVGRVADRVQIDPDGTIVATWHGTRCVLQQGSVVLVCGDRVLSAGVPPLERDGTTYVALPELVRGFGGEATFDARNALLVLHLSGERRVATPAPFDPTEPQVAPVPVFTPQPPGPTPRPAETGPPRPRRTAIPAVPSR